MISSVVFFIAVLLAPTTTTALMMANVPLEFQPQFLHQLPMPQLPAEPLSSAQQHTQLGSASKTLSVNAPIVPNEVFYNGVNKVSSRAKLICKRSYDEALLKRIFFSGS
jgi:hypothetical protein